MENKEEEEEENVVVVEESEKDWRAIAKNRQVSSWGRFNIGELARH